MNTHLTTNASGLYVVALLVAFVVALAVLSGIIDHVAWTLGGGL